MLVSQLLQLFISLAELMPISWAFPQHPVWPSDHCHNGLTVVSSPKKSVHSCIPMPSGWPHSWQDSWIQSGPAGQEYGMVWQPTIPLPFTSLLVRWAQFWHFGLGRGILGKTLRQYGLWKLRAENPHLGLWRVFSSWPKAGAQEPFAEWRIGAKAVWAPSSDLIVGNKGILKPTYSFLSSFLGHGKGSSKNYQDHFSLCIVIRPSNHPSIHPGNTSWHITLYIREVGMNKGRSLPWRD